MQDLGHVELGRQGEPLRILQLTDLHHFPASCTEFEVTCSKGHVVQVSHDEAGVAGTGYNPQRCLQMIKSVLERSRPDLVVLTGDIIDGRPFGAAKPQDEQGWRAALLEVLRPIVAAGVAWTFVPGNHDDDECPWSREALLGAYSLGDAAPGCISRGATRFDHTLTVGPAPPPSTSSVRLWLFDSGGNNLEEPSLKYHTFKADAVAGYRTLSETLPKAGCALAYFHIPLPQCAGLCPVAGRHELFQAAMCSGKVPRPWCWQPFTWLVRMTGRDRIVGASKLESGLFAAFVERGDVRACFFGHDHYSDAVFLRDGIFMVYGRVGGTTPPVDWEGVGGQLPFQTGARVVEWSRRGECDGAGTLLRTWVECADGSEVGSECVLDAGAIVNRC